MITLFIVLAETVVQCWTGARSVHLLVGATRETEEWYGDKCEWRPIELEVEGRWYEAPARPCAASEGIAW